MRNAAACQSYQKVLRYYRNAKVLGVTASPDHGDARDLGQDFEEIAHEVSLIELIEAGYLASIKVRTVPISQAYQRVHEISATKNWARS